MITPSHILINGALTKFSKYKKYAWFGALGGFLPDIPIYIFTIFVLIFNYDMSYVWDTLYFSENLQVIFNLSHSFVLWGVIIGISLILKKKWFMVLAISSFFHIFTDFFLHASDAYAQFYPISDWRFYSPVSYYEAQFYGREFSVFETLLCIFFAYLLYKNSKKKIIKRILLGLISVFILFLGFNLWQLIIYL